MSDGLILRNSILKAVDPCFPLVVSLVRCCKGLIKAIDIR